MAAGLRARLTYANVMATVGVFMALGGGAYAAVKLPANSVGSKQIKKSAITAKKIGKDAVDGSKVKNGSLTALDINVATLPKAPSAANADHAANSDNATHATNADNATNATNATTATNLVAPEAFHEVGAAGEPAFSPGASNYLTGTPTANYQTAGFFKDKEGIVHLKGFVTSGTNGLIFRLPAGYQLASKRIIVDTAYCQSCSTGIATLGVAGPDTGPTVENAVVVNQGANQQVSLNGFTFRADE
jgi:hypothetical protein